MTVSLLPQIFAMADALNLEIVAEGIESEEQAQYFSAAYRRICAHGWLYGRAMPIDEFLETLAADPKRPNPLVISDANGR